MFIAVLSPKLSATAPPDALDALAQRDAVVAALRGSGHRVVHLAVDRHLTRLQGYLAACAPDLVFNLVDELGGSCRDLFKVPARLEGIGIPFTGSGAAALRLTASKVGCKRLLAQSGIPTPAWATAEDLANAPLPEAGRWIVKSVYEHASLGLEEDCVLEPEDAFELASALRRLGPRLGGEAFAERFVAGREWSVSLLGRGGEPEALPPAEMLFGTSGAGEAPVILGYASKWHEDSAACAATNRSFAHAPEDADLLQNLAEQARACWRLFGLRGWARVDFRVDAAGTPFVIDVNANPCLALDAGFAAALDASGYGYAEGIARIVAEAKERAGRRQGARGRVA